MFTVNWSADIMEIRISQNEDGVYFLELVGDLDLYNSTQLKDQVIRLIGEKITHFVISLDEVERINSSGIGALIYIFSTLKKLNCRLIILASEGGPVLHALEITRLRGYFTIARSMEEAISLIAAADSLESAG
jgi:anti-sigma B factor antagonist